MKFSDCLVLNLGDISRDTPNEVARRIGDTPRERPIILLINSGGGDVEQGNAIAGAVSMHGNVIGLVIGKCDSMALSVFVACSSRLALPHATFFFHSRTREMGNMPILMLEDPAVVERARQEMLGAHHRYEEAIASAMGQPCGFIRELCRRETRLNAVEARKHGLVERIIDPELALLFQDQPTLTLEDDRR